MKLIKRKFLFRSSIVLIIIIGTGFAVYLGRRPLRSDLEIQNIHPGVDYYRGSSYRPYLNVYHLLEIDLTTPGLSFVGTEPAAGRDYAAQTVKEFAEENGTQIAINANFFFPFESNSPWDYYPHQGDYVKVDGIVIDQGIIHNQPRSDRPSLCISAEPRAEINKSGLCPSGTMTAIAGNLQTLVDGQQIQFPNEDLLPRTVVGVNESGDKMWILVVDGRQPFYSAGATHYFTSRLLRWVGASDVLNLDGGGSVTMVVEQDGEQQVLNAPIHTRVVMRERPVANHLGIKLDDTKK